jgi:outer membrane protein assembly factor BamB
MRLFRGRGTAPAAVIALAVVLVVFVVWFGATATLTRNSAQFGRLTALSGVYALVLAALAAAVTMTAWAVNRHRDAGKEPDRATDDAAAEKEPGRAPAPREDRATQPSGASPRPLRRIATVAVASAVLAIAGLFIAIGIDPGRHAGGGTPHASGTSAAPRTPTPPASGTSSVSPALGTVGWTDSITGSVTASPAVADGTIYLATSDGVYALSATSGHASWNQSEAGLASTSPEADDGTVYVGTSSGYAGGAGGVYALSASDGQVLWQYPGDEFGLAAAGGTVYAASSGGEVYALSADGKLQWQYSTGFEFGSGLAVAGGTIYVAAYTGLEALDAAGGRVGGQLLWTYSGDGTDTPVVAGRTVYVGSADGKVHALDTGSGAVRWTWGTGIPVKTSLAVAGGTVYVGAANGTVYALSTASGRLLWSYPTSEPIESSPVVAGGDLYVANQGGVYVLNTANGQVLWTYSVDATIDFSPAVANGYVYVATQNETMYALRPPHSL